MTDYRAMPSAASPQRHGQIIAKQFKSFAKASGEYKKHPEKFLGKPNLPGIQKEVSCFLCRKKRLTRLRIIAMSITGGELVDFQPLIVKCQSSQRFNVKATGGLAGDLRMIPRAIVSSLNLPTKEGRERTRTIRP